MLSVKILSDFDDKSLCKCVLKPKKKSSLRGLRLAITNSLECFPQSKPVNFRCAVALVHLKMLLDDEKKWPTVLQFIDVEVCAFASLSFESVAVEVFAVFAF